MRVTSMDVYGYIHNVPYEICSFHMYEDTNNIYKNSSPKTPKFVISVMHPSGEEYTMALFDSGEAAKRAWDRLHDLAESGAATFDFGQEGK